MSLGFSFSSGEVGLGSSFFSSTAGLVLSLGFSFSSGEVGLGSSFFSSSTGLGL